MKLQQDLDWAAEKLWAATRNSVFSLFVATLSLTLGGVASADVILAWNTVGNTGLETFEASVANLGVAASNLTLGAGVTAAGNTNRFGGNNWFDAGDTNPTTLGESITGNDYIQFIMTPNADTSISLNSFVFRWDRSGTGPDSVALRSSLDNFSNNLGQLTALAGSTTTDRTINLALNNITSGVTFRLYGFGATGTGGTGGFDTDNVGATNNVVLNGTVTAVPEPSSMALVGLLVMGTTWIRRRR